MVLRCETRPPEPNTPGDGGIRGPVAFWPRRLESATNPLKRSFIVVLLLSLEGVVRGAGAEALELGGAEKGYVGLGLLLALRGDASSLEAAARSVSASACAGVFSLAAEGGAAAAGASSPSASRGEVEEIGRRHNGVSLEAVVRSKASDKGDCRSMRLDIVLLIAFL